MRVLGASVALALSPAPALAQNDAADPIVVTASRTAPPPPSASVISGPPPVGTALPSLTDRLARLPGVRAFRKGGLGGSTYLAIRGGEPNYTAVLLEGALVTDPSNSQGGGFDLSQLSPVLIEEVRVVPGALSAVQGAEALSGIVDLRLRAPTNRMAEANIAADDDGGVDLGGASALPIGTGALLIGASYYDRDSERQQAGLRRTQVIARGTASLDPVEVGVTALHADTERRAFPEDSGGTRLALNRDRTTSDGAFTLLAADAHANIGPVLPTLSVSWSRTNTDSNIPPIFPGTFDGVPGIVSDTRFERAQADAGAVWATSASLSLAAGASFVREDGESDGSVDVGFPLPAAFSIERDRVGAYVEATARPLDRTSVTASVRYDDPDTLAGEWTVRAAATAQPFATGPELFASYGEGYRLPSLFALAYPLIANPDLRPERSRSWEFGARQSFSDALSATLTLFDTRYTDLIDFDAEAFTNVNRARVDTRGAEMKASLADANWSASGSVSLIDVDNEAEAPPLRSRPEWQGAFDLRHHWKGGSELGGHIAAIGNSFDASIPTGLIEQDGHVVFGLDGSVPLSRQFSIGIAVENLFGADYEEAIGVPALGRTISVGLRATFE